MMNFLGNIYIYIYSVRCSPAKPRQCSTCSEGAELKHPCTQDLSSSPTGIYIYIYIINICSPFSFVQSIYIYNEMTKFKLIIN